MKMRKKFEMWGSILMSVGFCLQFFVLATMANDRNLSFTIEMMENQAKIYAAIYENSIKANIGQKADTTRLGENWPTYSDQTLDGLSTLDKQYDFLSYVFGFLFVVGSGLNIFARFSEHERPTAAIRAERSR